MTRVRRHGPDPAAATRRPHDDADVALPVRLGIYRKLQEMRQFEKRAYDLFMQQLVKGTSHLSLGMEAIAAGFGAAMRKDDYTFATYRGHAHTLARGVPMAPVLAELLGRANGPDGRQGRLDAPHQRRARRDGLLRDHRRAPADRRRRGVVGSGSAAPVRWRSASSATARRTSARSTRR